jgi:hypothetical protein
MAGFYTMPLRMTVVGPCGTGKTSYMKYICDRKRGPIGRAMSTIIVIGTGLDENGEDYTYADALMPPDEEMVGRLLEKQQRKPKAKRKSLLLVFEDLIGSGWEPQTVHKKLFKYLQTTARHVNCHVIYVVQYVKGLSPIIRENTTITVLTGCCFSPEQIRHVCETLPVGKRELQQCLQQLDRPGKVLEVKLTQPPRVTEVPGQYATIASY